MAIFEPIDTPRISCRECGSPLVEIHPVYGLTETVNKKTKIREFTAEVYEYKVVCAKCGNTIRVIRQTNDTKLIFS